MGGEVSKGWNALTNNVSQGFQALGNNINQGINTTKSNLENANWNPNSINQSALNTGKGLPWGPAKTVEVPQDNSGSPLASSNSMVPYGFNGAQAGYQSGLLPINTNLNPNTNYNINAQANPFSNVAQGSAMRSPGVPQGGGK